MIVLVKSVSDESMSHIFSAEVPQDNFTSGLHVIANHADAAEVASTY